MIMYVIPHHAHQRANANNEAKAPHDPLHQEEVKEGSVMFSLTTTSYSGTRKCCISVCYQQTHENIPSKVKQEHFMVVNKASSSASESNSITLINFTLRTTSYKQIVFQASGWQPVRGHSKSGCTHVTQHGYLHHGCSGFPCVGAIEGQRMSNTSWCHEKSCIYESFLGLCTFYQLQGSMPGRQTITLPTNLLTSFYQAFLSTTLLWA